MPNLDAYGRESNNDSLTMRARAAMISAQVPSLSAGDTHVLAQRQYTDQENARLAMQGGAAGGTRAAAAEAMRVGAGGPGGIDVRSYSGSLYNGTAAPIAGYQRPETPSQAADRILRGRFGLPPNERGQVDIADAMGARSVNAPGGYSAPNRPAALAAAMAPTGTSPGSAGGVPDYATPPTNVDALLRDARAPLVAAMEDRRLMAKERTANIESSIEARRAIAEDRSSAMELKRSKEAQEQANKAALFKAMQPQSVLPDAAAVGAAFRSGAPIPKVGSREPTFAEAMRGYLGAGGAPNTAAESAMKPLGTGPAWIDFKVDPVTGARFAVGSKGNFAASGTEPGMPGRAPKNGAKPTGTEQIEIGGQPYIFHHETKRYFSPDGSEAFVKGPAPKAPDPLLKSEDPELYKVQREAYLDHFKAKGAAAPAADGPGAKPGAAAAGAKPSAKGAAEPAKPAAGTRATQNGVVFEYDGKAWNPVK